MNFEEANQTIRALRFENNFLVEKTKKNNFQKPKQKKRHLYYHCGAVGHTRPNCYK